MESEIQEFKKRIEVYLKKKICTKSQLATVVGISRQSLHNILNSDSIEHLRQDTTTKIRQFLESQDEKNKISFDRDFFFSPHSIKFSLNTVATMSENGLLAVLKPEDVRFWMKKLLENRNLHFPIDFVYPSLRNWIYKSSPNWEIFDSIVKEKKSKIKFVCNSINCEDLKIRGYNEVEGYNSYSENSYQLFVRKRKYKETNVYKSWSDTLKKLKDISKKHSDKIETRLTKTNINTVIVKCQSFVFFFNVYPSQTKKLPSVCTFGPDRFIYDSSSHTYITLSEEISFLQKVSKPLEVF